MRSATLLFSGALVLGMSCASVAQAVDPATLASTGDGAAMACATCHGADGGGIGLFPRLAGMNAAYLEKQLADFDSGTRANGVMEPIAKALSAEDRTGIARHYAAMPVSPAKTAEAPATAGADSPGARLALRGNWSAGVPACVQCHGPGGSGVGDAFPAIAAQPAGYLAAQLRAWQAGTRRNDPIELMRHLSAKLSDAEIDAVAQWFSLQPATVTGERP